MARVGAFRSTVVGPELGPVLHRSALTVVWFQAVLDVPSGKGTDHPLDSMRWEEPAQDHEL